MIHIKCYTSVTTHGKRRSYISDDTLSHALTKMLGQKDDSKKRPMPNILGKAGIEHFTIHDLSRSCRAY